MWEKEKILVTSIFTFSHSVFYSIIEIVILATFNLLSANAFNFVTSKILLFGKELKNISKDGWVSANVLNVLFCFLWHLSKTTPLWV